jgi:SAM-dependent methyltransferase
MVEQSAVDVAAHYALGLEADRLDEPLGVVEFVRTAEILERVLPPAPATVADIGGGPGRYALWLADRGHQVVHRDLVPLHVDQLRAAGHPHITTDVGDARALDLDDVFAVADRISVLYLGRMAAQVKAKDVTSNQVVELITTSRSGSIGLPTDVEPDAEELQEGMAEAAPADSETVSAPAAATREDTP